MKILLTGPSNGIIRNDGVFVLTNGDDEKIVFSGDSDPFDASDAIQNYAAFVLTMKWGLVPVFSEKGEFGIDYHKEDKLLESVLPNGQIFAYKAKQKPVIDDDIPKWYRTWISSVYKVPKGWNKEKDRSEIRTKYKNRLKEKNNG